MLNANHADVLHIMDCCYATEAVDGNAEVLSATSTVDKAGGDPDACFTKTLVEELRRASSNVTTVVSLHAEMVRNRDATKLYYTPVYTQRQGKPSITLQKLRPSGPHGNHLQPSIKADGPRILLTAHVADNVRKQDLDTLKGWILTQVPTFVTGIDVTVEGVWAAESTLMLFSVPIEIWNRIRDHAAWSYVGTVNSTNKLLGPPASAPAQNILATRPPSGGENVRPTAGSSK